ncbi:unnamed protein product [Fusarium venenatum]|uniref:Uncharacterized protein n=1 Tax=Fusarium venenatum TaxID=56646 RepID=A0A2L2SYS7_9HYPO|nr:uncharacterized protein FVRRES_11374 [Fusarium venenatum]CEI38683.1 unnamed protein product [Fusarium venenatum]
MRVPIAGGPAELLRSRRRSTSYNPSEDELYNWGCIRAEVT